MQKHSAEHKPPLSTFHTNVLYHICTDKLNKLCVSLSVTCVFVSFLCHTMSALLGDNLHQDDLEAFENERNFSGASTIGIGEPGNAPILRFSTDVIKKHIKKWMAGPKEKNSFNGIEKLEKGVVDGLLRPGQLIFGTVSIKHHEAAEGTFQGWIYDSFSPLLTMVTKKQKRPFAYLHVAVYAGKQDGVNYFIENYGHDGDGYGRIRAVPIDEAFEDDAHFFVVSPPKDKAGKSTRYIIIQRALACIGVQYEYHMRAVSCETFCTAILYPLDDSFHPIQRSIVRSHKNNLPTDDAAKQLEEDKQKYKKFHSDLCCQMKKVPKGCLLSLKLYKEKQSNQTEPWFEEIIQSYSFFQACRRYGFI